MHGSSFFRLFLVGFLALGLAGASFADTFGQGDAGAGEEDVAPDPAPASVEVAGGDSTQVPGGARQTGERLVARGRASWYGPGFHGRKTASGERYDQNALTAAMTSVPLGTVVRVLRVDTGYSVVVKVNDRGPYERRNGRWVPHRTRVIDLSKRAMEILGGLHAGTIRVEVYVGNHPAPRR